MAFKDQWTEEQDDFLRRCAEQGQSTKAAAALLSEIFGLDRTKMAVIGRAHRKGIVFRGQQEYQARQRAEATIRKESAPKRVRAPKPQPDTKIVAANLIRRRAQLQVEAAREQPARLAAEVAEMDAATAEAAGDNQGVLFLDRKALQCAWPLPGWNQAGPWEKRVCGKPVVFRPSPLGAEPTSWCRDCKPLVYSPHQRRPLDAKALGKLDKSVRAA